MFAAYMCITDTANVWFATPHKIGMQIKNRLNMITKGNPKSVNKRSRFDKTFLAYGVLRAAKNPMGLPG